jgi:hypothetical protein
MLKTRYPAIYAPDDGGRAADGMIFMMGDVEISGTSIVFKRIP